MFESIIFVTLSIILYGLFGVASLPIIVIIFWLLYWLPKFILIQILEYVWPMVLTRNTCLKLYDGLCTDLKGESIPKNIALTFDDVPRKSYREIIDLLNAHDMKATFFIISSQVNEKSKEILIDAVKAGHQLGNHGTTDSIHLFKSTAGLEKEINDCHKLIANIYEKADKPLPEMMLYRPGCGLFNKRMLDIVHKKNYRLTLGSVYPNDPLVSNAVINYHYVTHHIEIGDIIILHDRPTTPRLLKLLLPWMLENNYQSVTVSELFEDIF
jgi:peptidoglycan/xylan/chitin deacetylase (PgdA/CDA1 family)